MAMNKKEQTEMEVLRSELAKAKAFRFTERIKPDIPIASGYTDLRKGFLFNEHSSYEQVKPACSTSSNHCFGSDQKTTTQGGRSLFSTEVLAWRALRNALEDSFAERLAKIDERIHDLYEKGSK
jgi:hypothetical protein